MHTTITVAVTDETGAAHDGTGTATSSIPINGLVHRVDFNFGAAQTGTLDTTCKTAGNNGLAASIVAAVTNSPADVTKFPLVGALTAPFMMNDYAVVVLAQADNETEAAKVTIYWEPIQ